MHKGVGRKISGGGGGGGRRKKDRKMKNSTFKPLPTIFVPCMKIQGELRPPCPPLPTPMAILPTSGFQKSRVSSRHVQVSVSSRLFAQSLDLGTAMSRLVSSRRFWPRFQLCQKYPDIG